MTSKNFHGYIILIVATTCVHILIWQCNGAAVFTADTLGFHGRLCSPISKDFGKVSSTIACSAHCSHHSGCLGVFYSSIDKSCLGVSHVVTSITGCSSVGVNSTYKFYRKSVGGISGSPCTKNTDCISPNTGCVDAMCQCVGGYKYNSTIYACAADCTIYGETFTRFTDLRLDVTTIQSLLGVTPEECLAYCSTLVDCRSANYRLAGGDCYMKGIVAFQSPGDYLEALGIIHYVRNCV